MAKLHVIASKLLMERPYTFFFFFARALTRPVVIAGPKVSCAGYHNPLYIADTRCTGTIPDHALPSDCPTGWCMQVSGR